MMGMFVTKGKYNAVVEELEMLKASMADQTRTIQNKAQECNKLRQALHAIDKQLTPGANATVRRMASYARAALKGTFGNKKIERL